MDKKAKRELGKAFLADLKQGNREQKLTLEQLSEKTGLRTETLHAIFHGWTELPTRKSVESLSCLFALNPSDYGYPPLRKVPQKEKKAFPRSSIMRRLERMRDHSIRKEPGMSLGFNQDRSWMLPRTSEPEAYLTIREGAGINTVIELSGEKLDAVLRVLELGAWRALSLI